MKLYTVSAVFEPSCGLGWGDSCEGLSGPQLGGAQKITMELIPIPGAELYYDKHFLSPEEAGQLLNVLMEKCAMIVSGFLNVSRSRHSDGLTHAFSVIGNLLILVLAVGIAWPVRYHLMHSWQALGILVVTVIELSFALRG